MKLVNGGETYTKESTYSNYRFMMLQSLPRAEYRLQYATVVILWHNEYRHLEAY